MIPGVARALRRLRAEAGLVLAFAAGAALRLYQVTEQIPADDEWHALHALVSHGYAWILSHFGTADHSIPLTIYYKLLADTVGLSEMAMRLPILLAGVATPVVLPLLVRPEIGRPAATAFAWLLAIAPLHVYFSRYARPYAITTLLAFVGIIAFYRWASGRHPGWVWLYLASAVTATYLHPLVLPALGAPLLFALSDGLLRPGAIRARSPRDLLVLGAALAVGLAAVLGPPLLADAGSLARKAGRTRVTWDTLELCLELLVGTSHAWLLAAMLAVAAGGVWALARRQPRLLTYLSFVALYQVTIAALLEPDLVALPIVLTRYSLPAFPVLLLLAAVGLAGADGLARERIPRWPPGAAVTLASTLLLAFGPLPRIYYHPNNWTNHALFQYFYRDDNQYARSLRPWRVPAFYRQLAQEPPGSVVILEAPWQFEWPLNHFPAYQRVHRQWMKVGFVGDPTRFGRTGELPAGRGLHLRHFLHVGDLDGLPHAGVAYVVFHKNLLREAATRHGPGVDVSRWIARYHDQFGEPAFEDDLIAAFDVRPARRPRAAG